MEIFSIGVYNEDQKKALKAFVKALKMEIVESHTFSDEVEKRRILDSIAQGYRESLEIEAGKVKPKTIGQLLDEL